MNQLELFPDLYFGEDDHDDHVYRWSLIVEEQEREDQEAVGIWFEVMRANGAQMFTSTKRD